MFRSSPRSHVRFGKLFNGRERDSAEIPSVEDVKTMDSEYDKRFEEDVKRLFHMKKYKQKYKELLVGYFKWFMILVYKVQGGWYVESTDRIIHWSVYRLW